MLVITLQLLCSYMSGTSISMVEHLVHITLQLLCSYMSGTSISMVEHLVICWSLHYNYFVVICQEQVLVW